MILSFILPSRSYLNRIAFLGLFLMFIACGSETSESEDNGKDEDIETYAVVEELPVAKGGMDMFYNYIKQTITYPLSARVNGIEGQVVVAFAIERDGSLSNIEVVESLSEEIDNEAILVLTNADSFTPARQRGRTVRVRMSIPIEFKLGEATNEDGSPQGIVIIEDAQILHEQLTIDASFSDGSWSGTVFNSAGEPLPGANIVVKGTNTGTVSALDGTFSVNAEKNQNIVISFVGFETVALAAE